MSRAPRENYYIQCISSCADNICWSRVAVESIEPTVEKGKNPAG